MKMSSPENENHFNQMVIIFVAKLRDINYVDKFCTYKDIEMVFPKQILYIGKNVQTQISHYFP